MSRNPDDTLSSGEVAKMFRVDVKTVSRWAKTGRLTFTRTAHGQYRFDATEVRLLKEASLKRREES